MKPHLSIIHYQPIEFYPPVMNLMNTLASTYEISVHTCRNQKSLVTYQPPYVSIHRYPSVEIGQGIIKRLFSYFTFTWRACSGLLRERPNCLLYYETNSVFPVVFFYLLVRRKPMLCIHYHEYNSEEQYKTGMKLVYLSYLIEKKYLWKRAAWISHTNAQRMELFRKDYPCLETEKLHLLPNYPPKAWQTSKAEKNTPSEPIRIVYVGSLGLDNFYLKEFCTWVLSQNGAVQFDIYSQNSTPQVQQYLQGLDTRWIKSNFTGTWYYDLPKVLRQYDVGVILYKGFNQNFTFNETNKLFEYHVCGLDVWFSEETLGIHKYKTQHTYPRIVAIDFRNLDPFNWHDALRKEGMEYRMLDVNCENIYIHLFNYQKSK